ncbi:MAG: post-PEP-CTERM-1 domain-containing protein [Massilia sp.]
MKINVLICCCALTASGMTLAAEPVEDGMTVVRDAQTGKLRPPTAAEVRALRSKKVQPLLTNVAPVKSTVRPDGTRRIDLGERALVYAVISRSADGKLTGHCVSGEAAATKALGQQETSHER